MDKSVDLNHRQLMHAASNPEQSKTLFFKNHFYYWIIFQGALAGTISSLSITCWIALGSFLYPNIPTMLPLETFNCPSAEGNMTTTAFTSTFTSVVTTTQTPPPESGGSVHIHIFLFFQLIWCKICLDLLTRLM